MENHRNVSQGNQGEFIQSPILKEVLLHREVSFLFCFAQKSELTQTEKILKK